MGRPLTQKTDINIDVDIENLEKIYTEFKENKKYWMDKLDSGGYIKERDRLRQAIRRRKHEDFNEYAADIRRNLKKRNRELIENDYPMICTECGFEGHHSQMDFHHKDPTKKEGNIGHMIANTKYEKLLIELKKCILLCSNCHRLLHWAERYDT